ncbi:hypothetical protein HK102_006000 [Quaeritorhiza haematococci]|nr:hypothetical protein HK102_006000 [Quaeritorhiza haematococci]
MITPETFKSLCMLADTQKGDEVRQYFSTMENIVQNYTLMQNAFTTQQHQHQLKQQATENRALQQQLQAKESELQKYVNKTYEEIETTGFVYLVKTDGGFKVGRTKNIDQRIGGLQTSNANDIEVLFKFPTSDPVLLEATVHKVLDPYRRRSKREYFDCDPGYIATTNVRKVSRHDEIELSMHQYSPQNRSKRHIVHNTRIVRKTNKVSGV